MRRRGSSKWRDGEIVPLYRPVKKRASFDIEVIGRRIRLNAVNYDGDVLVMNVRELLGLERRQEMLF